MVDLSRQSSPRLSEIRASLMASTTSRNVLMEKYSPELFLNGSYAETREKPIIAFLPVFSPVRRAQIGIRQQFKKGIDAQLQLTANQQSGSSPISGKYQDVTTNLLSLTVQMDLWRDLFGRVSESQRESAELELKKARIEEEISSKAMELTARKLYWSLVANTEQLKIATRLLQTAQDQLKDSRRRLSKSIGDSGDVARYEALLAERNAQSIFFRYQRVNLIRSLKEFFPQISENEVEVSGYNIDQTVDVVAACSMSIAGSKQVPWEHTKYDEMVTILKEQRKLQQAINQRYSDVDVKLYGTVKSTGVGSEQAGPTTYKGSYGKAFDDMNNNNRSGFETGVNVVIPLGDAASDTKKSRTIYDEERLKAQIDRYDAQITSTHSQLSQSLALIAEVVLTQRVGTEALQRRMKVVREKYSQARASVNDLILDQDALLNSELATLDSQLQAVNILFDYLMVFPETPCSFNRI